MKLIYILNSRMPTERAYGIQVAQMCEALAKLGTKVVLLYPKRDNPLKDEDFFSYYGIENSFETRELFSIDLLKYKFLGRFSFWLGALSFYFSVFFYSLFKLQNFKFVYTRDFYAPIFLKVLRKKVIFEIHNLPRKSFLFKYFLNSSDGIVAITKNLKEELVRLGIIPAKILYLPDGVDLEKFNIEISGKEARERLGLPAGKKIILYSGHLYEWKGAGALLEAARNFQFPISNFQSVLFVFVGGKEEDIKNFQFFHPAPIRRGGLVRDKIFNFQLKNVLFVGHRPYQEIPYWLKSADVLVLPNSGKEPISKFYTSPLKLFEYMASGNPIVASDLPSIREILNEQNSILVESDNPQALAQGIKKALNNQVLSDIISKRALEDVQNYTWRKRAEKAINFIKYVK